MDDLELCCSLEEIRVVFVLFGDIWIDPDDRKTPKGRWEDRNRACRPDRGLKQQGRSWWTSLKCRQKADGIISTKVPLDQKGK